MPTKATLKLAEIRNSAEMQLFKKKVLDLLQFAEPDIQYHIVKDLSRKINLPFYKETQGKGTKNSKTSIYVVEEYCKLCVYHFKNHGDEAFIKDFLMHLSEQQDQHLRKLSQRPAWQKIKRKNTKNRTRKDVWEHPIPLTYTRTVLFNYIKNGQESKIKDYINFIAQETYQVFLKEEWNKKLNALGLRDNMPHGWNWEKDNAFQRYIDADIPKNEYLLSD